MELLLSVPTFSKRLRQNYEENFPNGAFAFGSSSVGHGAASVEFGKLSERGKESLQARTFQYKKSPGKCFHICREQSDLKFQLNRLRPCGTCGTRPSRARREPNRATSGCCRRPELARGRQS